jgi:hypothetical protein
MDVLRDVAAVVDGPWRMSAGSDLDYPEVAGPRPPEVMMANNFAALLQSAASRDREVTRTFMRVAGLVDPPQALQSPEMIYRVLKSGTPRPAPAAV